MLEAREVANEKRLTGKFVLLDPEQTWLLTCGGLEVSSWNLIHLLFSFFVNLKLS